LVHAQAPPPPPQPPGFDPSQEFEELDDDSLDMSNDPGAFRPPNFNGTPPPASTQNTPPPDTSPSDHTAFGQTTGKVRFQVVEGEFYEKGKKRTRGKLH
jgi:hypothetical protein